MGATRRRFIGPGGIGLLSALLLVLGFVGLVSGVFYWINGLTQVHTSITVPVHLLASPGAPEPGGDPGQVLVPVAGLPPAAFVSADRGNLDLSAWDSTLAEQALARADTLLLGLAMAFAAYLLIPLLRSVQEAHPFDDGNARRIAGLTVALLVAGWLGPFLTRIGSLLVIDRLGIGGVEGGLEPAATPDLAPLLLAAVLLAVLAEAFRRGAQIRADVDGLV